MTDFSFIHCADLHLDSPLRGLRRIEHAPDIQHATRKSLEKMIQLALDEQIQFMIIAGDLYDGDWPDYHTGLFFSAQMRRLEAANIPVFLVYGNHDAQSQISKQLRLPKNVHVFDSKTPETHHIQHLNVALHGQSFAVRDVRDNLAITYPCAEKGFLNIGVLHTALTGREGHANYAPCALDDLKSKDYHYWALGHVHQYEEICHDPWVVYSGNIQGRHSRETGKKGCVLVHVRNQHISSVKHHALHHILWHQIDLDVSECLDDDGLLNQFEHELQKLDPAQGIVRVNLTGETPLHHHLKAYSDALTAEFFNHTPTNLWLEKVNIRTCSPQKKDSNQEPSCDLFTWPSELDQETLQQYAKTFQRLKSKLPADIQKDIDPCNLEYLSSLYPDATSLLQSRMNGENT